MSKLDPMDLVQDKPITNNEEEEDDDPITASYPVFLNPALPLGRRLVVLQHPNRTDEAPRPPPTEMRLKAQAGMVEVDVPLDNTTAYDREKGLRWGRTLQSSMAVKNGGTHGLAGGFGVGAVQQRGPGKKRGEVEEDDILDWNEAVRQDKVLRTQTLGGQYPDADEVQYMVGVFQGSMFDRVSSNSLPSRLHHMELIGNLMNRGPPSHTSLVSCSSPPTASSYRCNHRTRASDSRRQFQRNRPYTCYSGSRHPHVCQGDSRRRWGCGGNYGGPPSSCAVRALAKDALH